VAIFIWVGGGEEAKYEHVRSALSGLRVGQAMILDFRTLDPDDPIARAVDLTLAGFQADFPVVRDETVVGLVTREDVLRALADRGADAPVASVMRRGFPVVDLSDPLDRALTRLCTSGNRVVPVLSNGRLAGLLTLENIGELVAVRASQGAHRATRPRGTEPSAAWVALRGKHES
jgi:CBS domain-containing protein